MIENWNDFNNAAPAQDYQETDNNDVETIRAKLIGNIDSVLRYLLPSGTFSQGRFIVGDIHNNRGDSLSVTLQGDKAGMWKDFATNEGGDIFSLWAGVCGLDIKSDFPLILEDIKQWLGHGTYHSTPIKKKNTPPIDELGKFTGKWDYHDAHGNLIACVYRYDPEDGGKQFRPWDVASRKHQAPTPRPLYNQPDMVKESQVVLVEGEKSAQALINYGICATTAMNGAKAPVEKTDWRPLLGKEVVVWPDKDKAGWEYAQNAAEAIKQAGAKSVSILNIPDDKPQKWDAADAVESGVDIKAFIEHTPRIEIIKSSGWSINLYDWQANVYEGKAPEQQFLVDQTFPMGVVSILAAMGDTGKGMLTLDLALKVAFGHPNDLTITAFGNRVGQHGTAVIFTAEDDQAEVHRRLERLDPYGQRLRRPDKLLIVPLPNAGGAFPLVSVTKDGPEATKQFHHIKEQLLKIADLKLIVFDPLSSFIHADVNADPAAGSFSTGLLASLATETSATLIIAHHMRKPPNGKAITSVEQARDAIRGTSALVDGVRLAYAMWPAAQDYQDMVFKDLDETYERSSVYEGAVVKSNGPADRTIRTYLRNKQGLLVDVTSRIVEAKTPEQELKELLIETIARAARNHHPFTHTGGTGVHRQRNRLPSVFHNMGRDKLERMVQELLNARPPKLVKGRATGSKEDKWLDVRDGPFAIGEGQFEDGAEEVFE